MDEMHSKEVKIMNHGRERSSGDCGCGCGISGFGHSMFFRRYLSEKERLQRLEDYRDQLKKELEGIEEHIQELKTK
jgi:hypothetical protein